MKNRFNFGDIVVVENNLVGVVVKCWSASLTGSGKSAHDEVYVRSYNAIKEYPETEIEPFIYDKELAEEQEVDD